MDTIDARFTYPKHDDFFVVEKKNLTLKPEYAEYVAAHPSSRAYWDEDTPLNHRGESCYTERGTLLCLPEGLKYKYKRDEINENSVAHVKEGMVVSAVCAEQNKTADNVWPVFNETFFKDIPEIDNLVSRLEKACEIGTVKKPEIDRVMPFIKNQRIAHEILNEICERYGMKRNDMIEVHSRKCCYGGPRPSMEPFDYTLFCYIGQGLYKREGPYHGQRIFCIDFPGTDFLYERVQERFYPKKK